MSESVNVNVTAKEDNSGRVPQRFSFENSGVRKHKKGDIYEYKYSEDVDLPDSEHRSGLIVIDVTSGAVQTADVSATPFDLLSIIYGLCKTLEIPLEALDCLKYADKMVEKKAMKAAMSSALADRSQALEDLDPNDLRPSGIGLMGLLHKRPKS